MKSTVSVCTAVALVAAVTVFCPGTASAATQAYKKLRLRQDTPITATGSSFCPAAATDHDGWHFIVPRRPRSVSFISLSVTFDPGGTQTITSFAGQADAFVFSERGARLIGATAVVEGGLLRLLTLSHFDLAETCAGRAPQPAAPAAVPEAPRAPPPPPPSPSPRPRPVPAKPSRSAATASPSVSDSVTRSPTPDVTSSFDDQPQIQLHDPGSTMVADAREEQAGLGFQGFVLIAIASFLILFVGSSALIVARRGRVNAWPSGPPGTGPSPLP